MSHALHHELPGYDGRHIWHDGCQVCEMNGRNVPYSVGMLSDDELMRALARAKAYLHSTPEEFGSLALCEVSLLTHLGGVLSVVRRVRYAGRNFRQLV